MPLVNSLLSICIAKYHPNQMMQIIEIADRNGYDFNFIEQNVAKFDTTLEKMNDFNRRFEPWWGLPYRVAAYTIHKPEGEFVRMEE